MNFFERWWIFSVAERTADAAERNADEVKRNADAAQRMADEKRAIVAQRNAEEAQSAYKFLRRIDIAKKSADDAKQSP